MAGCGTAAFEAGAAASLVVTTAAGVVQRQLENASLQLHKNCGHSVVSCHALMLCRLVWRHSMPGPIFSTPVVNGRDSVVVAAAVNGNVNAVSRHGQVLWQCNLAAQVYAPLSLPSCDMSGQHQSNTVSAQQTVTMPEQQQHHSAKDCCQEATCDIDVPCTAQGCAGASVMIGDVQGGLHCLEAASGQQQWACRMPSAINTAVTNLIPTSAAPLSLLPSQLVVDDSTHGHAQPPQHLGSAADAAHLGCISSHASTAALGGTSLLVACTTSGVLTLLSTQKQVIASEGRLLSKAQDVFSRVCFGCSPSEHELRPKQPLSPKQDMVGPVRLKPTVFAVAQLPGVLTSFVRFCVACFH